MISQTSQKILVLDDEHNYAKMLVDLLRNRGCQADFSTSPIEALQQLRESQFALVVADFKMPEMDGAGFLTELRKFLPELPVIMISGFMNTPELLKVANIGVTLVLEKPFDANQFFDCVRRFVHPGAPVGGDDSAHIVAGKGERVLDDAGIEIEFPDPSCLFAGSKNCKSFLQALYREFNSSRDIWIVGPAGSEWELIAAELVAWKGLLPSLPMRLSALDLGNADLRAKLSGLMDKAESGFGKVFFIDYGESLPDEAVAAQVKDFIAWLDAVHAVDKGIHCLHGLPVDALRSSFFEALPTSARSSWLMLRPLSERPLELAFYVRELLSERSLGRSEFSDGALPILLGYSWPGNYLELRSVINRIALHKQRQSGTIGEEDLITAFNASHRDWSFENNAVSLQSFLHRQQKIYLNSCANSGQSMERLLKAALENDVISVADLDKPAELPFLFSQLLVSNSSSN